MRRRHSSGTDVKGGGDEVSNMIRTANEVLEENAVVGKGTFIEEEGDET